MLDKVDHKVQSAIFYDCQAELLPRASAEPPADRPAERASQGSDSPAAAAKSPRPTREELLAVFKATGGNVRAMSRHFGKDRRPIYRWLKVRAKVPEMTPVLATISLDPGELGTKSAFLARAALRAHAGGTGAKLTPSKEIT